MSTEELESVSAPADAPIYLHRELTEQIIGAAMEVHRELGCGFLEKVYENALQVELKGRNIGFAPQLQIPVRYKGKVVGSYYADLVVARVVLCEIKALDSLTSIHEQQILHYLKATGIKIGLLLNFGTRKLQVKRLIF